ncbi:two-component regulator propeller domain-containing protein [Proteiniphilum sp. X52]|uniref:hybrid sensor histidine kinase/response regulator transcription factor n=1 Tax=Proteiniphilum sp. X52 TaxID=2382159 RepID=UPI0013141579|nr:two-component regulator propeller domain-containing protein [Proteiniphilum sp. X52]
MLLILFAHHFFTYGSGDINFSKIGIEEGLSQLSVMTIYQDELGNIWFGTREGVNIYNGITMRILQSKGISENSLSGNLIKTICGDLKGSIFIHTQNGVDKFDIKTETISPLVKMQVNAMNYGNNNLWYAKNNAIYIYKNGENYLFCEIEGGDQIITLLPVSDNRLFVGTISSGVYEIDQNKKAHKILPHCSRVSSLFEDSDHNIWISTWENGLYKIEKDKGILNYRKNPVNPAEGLSSDFVRAVHEDDYGDIWIGTKLGLDRLDKEQSLFHHYDSEINDDRHLSNESVWSLHKDRFGNIWIGTYFGGVNYFNPTQSIYTFHNLEKGIFTTKPFPVISEIIPYKENTLFLCTEGNGLIIYDTDNKSYKSLSGLQNENIKSVYYDETNEKLYLGLHLGGLSILDLQNYSIQTYRDIRPELDQSNVVRKILPYNTNYLIATHNGLYLFDKETASFSVFSEELHQHTTYFVDIEIDNANNLWVASRGVYKYNIKTKEIKPFFHDPNNEKTISNNDATKIFIDSLNRLWIGTSGGGVNLFDYTTSVFKRFTVENSGLRNNYISNITESPLGYIYLTTTQGLSYISPKDSIDIYPVSHDGLSIHSFFNGGITIKQNGEIYVAGMNGMISFQEQSILSDLDPIQLHFSDLWVNNQKVSPHDETKLLKTTLPYTESLQFNHKQSILKFEFASDHIIAHNQYQYLYRVKGLSNEWILLKDGINEINLINLNAGKYTLELMGISPRSKVELGRAHLPFKVTPPFYKSTVAYMLYLLTAMALIGSYIRYAKYKIRLESSLEFEKNEKAHLEEVNQSKIRFFTNISHEFRTPLTLIASYVDMLLKEDKLSPQIFSGISNIGKNTALMKNLIDELLDFRKIDNGKLSINAGEYNIVDFLHEIYLTFETYAKHRKIIYSFSTSDDIILVWFDQHQMQKVFFNLISNAFKYTPENGKIGIYIHQDSENVCVCVRDTGIGISAENIEKIFDSFYQVNNEYNSDSISSGTGLGLALTKGIVDAHRGEITLESKPGQGSNFQIFLRKGSAHFHDKEKIETRNPNDITVQKVKDYLPEKNSLVKQEQNQFTRFAERTINNREPSDANTPSLLSCGDNSKRDDPDKNRSRILIVEDNEELLDVLKTVFAPAYEVITAINGEEGLFKTIESQPDIVLSDLMMPVMSGSEMCLKIKNNFAVCHIPVVLLTAQTAIESNIESLQFGADDYITKPFNLPVLLARCNNLVNSRRILQERFAQSTDFNVSVVTANEIDQAFLEKANRIIEENIDNPGFGINEFSRKMSLGRTSLFNKIRGITGQTPNDFIITVKMKKATFLLSNHPELNISDVTYRLGFNSPKYFSTCFKNQFGMSPSEYRSKK